MGTRYERVPVEAVSLLQAALDYAARGWPVLPLHSWTGTTCSCGVSDCPSPAKHPRNRDGLTGASTDPTVISAWWGQWPAANVGLRTGIAFDVLDIDGDEGLESVKALVDEHGQLPGGPSARTGGGGFHLLFAPTTAGNRAGLRSKVDWRGAGGYIVAPPSVHASGNTYEWDDGPEHEAPEAPDWLKLIVAPPKAERPPGPVKILPANSGDGTAYGLRSMDAELDELGRAPAGMRNHSLNACAFNLFQLVAGGELAEGAVTSRIESVALGIGLGETEISKTMASARKGGMEQPRSAPELVVVAGAKAKKRDVPAVETRPRPPRGAPMAGWPQLDPLALHGPAGEMVRTIEPHTEADPAALLADLLVSFGSAVGSGPYAVADASVHPARLNAVVVGETARARKGTSRANVSRIFEGIDPDWNSSRVMSGLASGEGLIAAVRDGDSDTDPGVKDKRLLIHESEFARVLGVAARDGNTLSAVVRDAWDTGRLRVLTRKDPLVATGAHVSILGHITIDELKRRLSDTEAANGFANRFLFICARRSKLLPSGGGLDDSELARLERLGRNAIERARALGRMHRSEGGERAWVRLYEELAEEDPGGLVGAITARAEAQCLRLSVVYALLDGSRAIEEVHVEAAACLWRFAQESATFIFGESLGDEVADRLLSAINAAGEAGLDGTAQRDVFGRHISGKRLEAARDQLQRLGKIRSVQEETGGRPRTISYALSLAPKAL